MFYPVNLLQPGNALSLVFSFIGLVSWTASLSPAGPWHLWGQLHRPFEAAIVSLPSSNGIICTQDLTICCQMPASTLLSMLDFFLANSLTQRLAWWMSQDWSSPMVIWCSSATRGIQWHITCLEQSKFWDVPNLKWWDSCCRWRPKLAKIGAVKECLEYWRWDEQEQIGISVIDVEHVQQVSHHFQQFGYPLTKTVKLKVHCF